MLRAGDEVELPDIKWKQPADPDVGGQWGLTTHGSGRRFSYILTTTQVFMYFLWEGKNPGFHEPWMRRMARRLKRQVIRTNKVTVITQNFILFLHQIYNIDNYLSACDCEEGPGMFANFLTLGSLILVIAALPLSLFFVVKVVQVKHLLLSVWGWHTLCRSMRDQLSLDLVAYYLEEPGALGYSSSFHA